jgi:hypothetical protein
MKRLAKQDCPVVLSITDTQTQAATESVIQRNDTREIKHEESGDIYVRAREIYYRARRHRPVRAASIF